MVRARCRTDLTHFILMISWTSCVTVQPRLQSQAIVFLQLADWLRNKVHGDAFNDSKIIDGISIMFSFLTQVFQPSYCSE